MGFDQSSEVFVPMAMARGHRRADIEVVVGYQPVRCVYPTVRPFQHPYEAPSSGAGQDREIDVWCFTHAYAFPNRKVKSWVGKLREGSLTIFARGSVEALYCRRGGRRGTQVRRRDIQRDLILSSFGTVPVPVGVLYST